MAESADATPCAPQGVSVEEELKTESEPRPTEADRDATDRGSPLKRDVGWRILTTSVRLFLDDGIILYPVCWYYKTNSELYKYG